MTSRRGLLSAAAGLVFCGCGLPRDSHAQAAPARKLPVMVQGKRIKTVDVHSHCIFRDAALLLGDKAPPEFSPVLNSKNAYIVIEERLKAMDAMAIDMEVLSINPFWYGQDRDLAAKVVKLQNEKLAELCAAKPDRFAAFASLTLQDPALAGMQ